MGLLDSEEQPEQQEAAPVEDSESTDVDPDEESEGVSEEAEAEEVAPDFDEVESTDATLIESGEVDVAGSTRASVSDWLTNHVLKQKN